MKLDNFSQYEIYPNEGKIWSYRSQKWIGAKQKKGYYACALYSDDGNKWNTTVHRVIWIAVNGEIPNGYEVNHIDEDKSNNSISNLNLLTHKENINWGTCIERTVKSNTNNPKKCKAVGAYKDGFLIMTFQSAKEAKIQGFSSGHISQCCNGLRQSHKGYQWHFIN